MKRKYLDLVSILDILNIDFKNYLSYFDERIVKIKSQKNFHLDRLYFGNDIGPSNGTFVFPKKLAKKLIHVSDGDPRKLERLLSIEEGALGDAPLLIDVVEDYIVRIPTGTEKGANKHWRPGGYTIEGIPEAVVDCIKDGHYRVMPVFG